MKKIVIPATVWVALLTAGAEAIGEFFAWLKEICKRREVTKIGEMDLAEGAGMGMSRFRAMLEANVNLRMSEMSLLAFVLGCSVEVKLKPIDKEPREQERLSTRCVEKGEIE